MMFRNTYPLGAFFILISCLFSTNVTLAQSSASAFTAQEIEQFAQTRQAIEEIRNVYIAKISMAQSQQRRQTLRQEANQEMLAIITAHGLSVNRYNAMRIHNVATK